MALGTMGQHGGAEKHLRTPIAKALEAIIIVDCSSSRAALGAGDSHHAPVLPA